MLLGPLYGPEPVAVSAFSGLDSDNGSRVAPETGRRARGVGEPGIRFPKQRIIMEEFIPIFFFMCVAGVLILRPLTKRLGLLLEALAKERLGGLSGRAAPRPLEDAQVERIAGALDRLNSRIDLMDDRMAFVERLVEDRPRQRLTG